MALRLYFPDATAGAPAASPAYGSSWETTHIANTARSKLSPSRLNAGMSAGSISDTASAGIEDVLHRQYVSDATFAAKTIPAGTFSCVVKVSNSSATAQSFLQVVIRVVSGDGTTERGVLYAGCQEVATTATAGAQNQAISTTAQTRIYQNVTYSSLAVQAGDRLVVELGYREVSTGGTANTFTATLGSHSTLTDHALTAGATSTLNPWIEFSDTDLFVVTTPTDITVTGAAATIAVTGQAGAPAVPITVTGGTANVAVASLAGTAVAATPITVAGAVANVGVVAQAGTLDMPAGPVETSTQYANDGYGYTGTAEVIYDPPIAPDPARVRRAKVRRVHQSLPAPTLVDGRPT